MTKHMNINGVSIAYLEQGQGSPTLLLHGNSGDCRVWEPQRQAVAECYRFIALNQRYFGTDPWPDKGEKFSPTTHTDDLATFIRNLKAGPVNLVGWSYGGAVALELAVQHSELVSSLFLFEPTLGTMVSDPADAAVMGEDRRNMFAPAVTAAKAGDYEGAVKFLIDGVNALPGTFDSLAPEVRSIAIDNARVLPLVFAAPPPPPVSCAELEQVKVRVAVARGELTRPFFRIIAQAVSRCIPGSSLITVPQARHLWPVQNPSAFNEVLLGFLKSGS